MPMTKKQRERALMEIQRASDNFYLAATAIGNHPFIEFTGLMNEYIKCCVQAHENGVDFSDCNTHCGHDLPVQPYAMDYINEKLECIFTGRSVMSPKREDAKS